MMRVAELWNESHLARPPSGPTPRYGFATTLPECCVLPGRGRTSWGPRVARKPLFAPDWFPFYVNRVRWSDTLDGLDDAKTGAFWKMIGVQWREGRLPVDPEEIARKARAEVGNVVAMLGSFPKRGRTFRQNRALEAIRREQEAKHTKKVTAGRAGGTATAALQQRSRAAVPLDQTRPEKRREDQPDGAPQAPDSSGNGLVVGCGRCTPHGRWAGWLSSRNTATGKPCECPLGQLREYAIGLLRGMHRSVEGDAVWDCMVKTGRVT